MSQSSPARQGALEMVDLSVRSTNGWLRSMRRPLDFSIRSLQHPLDQLLDLGAGQDEVGELVPTVSGDEHPARIVDQQRSCERWLSPKNDEECSELGRTRS